MQICNMPAGKYFLGDPCYFFSDKSHDEWLHFLAVNDYYDSEGAGFLAGTNLKTCVFPTRYGDGEYTDDYGRQYGVDSGLIGLIPYLDGSDIPSYVHVVEFEKDFECFNDNGYLNFGDIAIDTVQDVDVYDDYDDYEYNSDNYDDDGVLYDEP